MKRIIIILMSIMFSIIGFTQDDAIVKELTKLRDTYKKNATFSVDIQYLLYVGNSSSAEESFTAHLTKKSNQYRLTSKEQTSIVNDKHALTINHTEKMALFQGVNFNENKSEVDPSSFDIESLLKLAHKTTELKNLTKGKKGVRFEFYSSQYEFIDVEYNASNYYIEKIGLKARVAKDQEPQRLEVRYSNMNTSPSITSSTFSTRKYITIKDQQASLKAAYKAYKLIN